MITLTLNAGVPVSFQMAGDFFRLMKAALPVTVNFYSRGAQLVEAASVGGGYAERFGVLFDGFTLTSPTTQSVQFVARLGSQVQYDTPPNGDVTITNVNGAFSQAAAVITNASAQLVAAKTNRRYLLIQNKSASGDIFVNLSGVAATTLNGIQIAAGSGYECASFLPTAAVFAIGSIASNPDVVVVEG